MSASWLRTLHRDLGYLAFGLTVVYAVSGIAVNHIGSWDPNYTREERVERLGPISGSPSAVAERSLSAMDVKAPTFTVTDLGPSRVDVTFDGGSISANPTTGVVVMRRDRPRPVLRNMNWLHLNRGKAAWTAIADVYAAILLTLGITGLCIGPVRRHILGRGGVFLALGIATPALYVWIAGP